MNVVWRNFALLLGLLALGAGVLVVAPKLRSWWREPIGPPEEPLPITLEEQPEDRMRFYFVGHTKRNILARFGPPNREWEGNHGCPPPESGWVTCDYDRPGGTRYMTFRWEDGEWICLFSGWLPEGVVF